VGIRPPQVHIFCYDLVSFSKVHYIMQACKEARDRGQKLLISYYQISTTSQDEGPEWKVEGVKHFINVDVDTIWLGTVYNYRFRAPQVMAPGFIESFCGRCNPRNTKFQILSRYPSKCQHDLHLRRLAIRSSYWENPDPGDEGPNGNGPANVLRQFVGVRELFIIVGDAAPARAVQDFEFTAPRDSPYQLLPIVGTI
jgi:hypothetical protein